MEYDGLRVTTDKNELERRKRGEQAPPNGAATSRPARRLSTTAVIVAVLVVGAILLGWFYRLEVTPFRDGASWAIVHNRWTGQVWTCIEFACHSVNWVTID